MNILSPHHAKNLSLVFGCNWSSNLHGRTKASIPQDTYRMAISVSTDYVSACDSQNGQEHELPPLVGALKASAEENAARFHFPGHNIGHAAPSSFTRLIGKKPYIHDLPELPELRGSDAPLMEAQIKAAELFGASETWFLVGGTTCGIQAAIMATCFPGYHIILPRNCHKSAISAMVLSGALPEYILPDYDSDWDIAGGITPSQVESAIKEVKMKGGKLGAVLVVSPTYHGICSDIAGISQICHAHNIPLIVDEAHGAHFGFHELFPTSALSQGADIAIQSTHKVLSSLTQSSMLHLSGDLVNRDKICKCLQMLQSSSPSYLLLASLDAARAQISDNRDHVFDLAVDLAVEAKSMINRVPSIAVLDIVSFPQFPDIDPLRITFGTYLLGLSGFEADDILTKEFGLVAELIGTRSITLAFNLGTQREHVSRLVSGLRHLAAISTDSGKSKTDRENDLQILVPSGNISIRLSPREAFFVDKRKVAIKDCVGQISGELVCPYPPGIPTLIPGEVISEAALDYLLEMRRKGADITGASDASISHLLVCDI